MFSLHFAFNLEGNVFSYIIIQSSRGTSELQIYTALNNVIQKMGFINGKHFRTLRNDGSKMSLSITAVMGQCAQLPPVRTPALGVISTVKGWWRVRDPLKEEKGKKKNLVYLVYFTLWCLSPSRLMERPDWIEVIFVFKLTEAGVERGAAERGFRKNATQFHSQRVPVREEET